MTYRSRPTPDAARPSRRGFTLSELLVSMTLTLAVFGIAVPFFRTQVRTVGKNAGYSDAAQNAVFAFTSIDRELRVAGVGVVDRQPMIVQADQYSVTFNADLMTWDPQDPSSVYYDASVDSTTTTSLPPARKVTLPRSAWRYPDSTYYVSSNVPSRAETISYYAVADSSTARTDDYIIYRRVNDATPAVITTGIILKAGEALFTYYRANASGRLDSIPATSLPMLHTAAVHSSSADVGASAMTDSLRAVRLRLTGYYKSPQGDSTKKTIEGTVRLLNAGLINHATCGDAPLATALTIARVNYNSVANNANALTNGLGKKLGLTKAASDPVVSLSWSASVDETGGEKDVERYILFRKVSGTNDWGEPIDTRRANGGPYQSYDADVVAGTSYDYALVAQDCSPQNSPLVIKTITP